MADSSVPKVVASAMPCPKCGATVLWTQEPEGSRMADLIRPSSDTGDPVIVVVEHACPIPGPSSSSSAGFVSQARPDSTSRQTERPPMDLPEVPR
jgi:hypothetical protein